jgi:hypothetical protein
MLIIIIVGASLSFGNRHLFRFLEAVGGEADISGNWQPDGMQSCSGGKFLTIADGRIGIVTEKAEQLEFNVVIVKVPQAPGPILILHPYKEPFSVEMLLHTDITDGKLTFIAAEWSETAINAFGDLFKEPDVPSLLSSLQRSQPYHRCP